ncbi:hypothetical protein BDW22DRAFT_1268665 [Trametopsis cervina]|nr:hypothetical protein BDW22DRAFT_1268665 [Trametopsis cervina]
MSSFFTATNVLVCATGSGILRHVEMTIIKAFIRLMTHCERKAQGSYCTQLLQRPPASDWPWRIPELRCGGRDHVNSEQLTHKDCPKVSMALIKAGAVFPLLCDRRGLDRPSSRGCKSCCICSRRDGHTDSTQLSGRRPRGEAGTSHPQATTTRLADLRLAHISVPTASSLC